MLPALRALAVASGRIMPDSRSGACMETLSGAARSAGGAALLSRAPCGRDDMRQKILAAVLLAGVAVALGWYFLWDGTQGSLVLYGNVEIRQVDVSFRVDGRIARVLVDEGDSVRAGQELACLDDDLLRQQRDQSAAQLAGQKAQLLRLERGYRTEEVEQARAAVARARAVADNAAINLNRVSAMRARNAISQKELDNARSSDRSARAELRSAQEQLDMLLSGYREEEVLAQRAAVDAAAAALEELKKANVDITVCIYHGGFENDLATEELLSDTGENQAYRICKELDFDILLTGHQHQAKAGLQLFGTYACQSPDRCRQYVRMEGEVSEGGEVSADSRLVDPGKPEEHLAAFLAPLDAQNAVFLDQPLGELDVPLLPGDHMEMAENGSLIANFFNQVQLEASGADLSVTSLANVVKGFNQQVTIRDVVATYVFPNTLQTLEVNRRVLKAGLERCAEYFALDGSGQLQVGQSFLKPIVQHYNFDYLSGLEVTMDIRRPIGDRVTSMLYEGKELEEGRTLTLCMNNYRATGTGGYPFYAQCKLVRDQPTEISQMIIEYIDRHKHVTVDKRKWLHVVY